MALHIECPVCEQQFSTPEVPADGLITCPSCAREFLRSAALDIEPDANNQSEPSYSNRLSVPPAIETTRELPHAVPLGEDLNETATKHSVDRTRRKRRRLITSLISSVILAGIIGVLIGLLVKQLNQNEFARNSGANDPMGLIPAEDQQSTTADPADEQPEQDPTPIEEAPEPRIAPEDIPPQQLDYWRRSQIRDQWSTAQPHLVSLKVFDGLGTHNAVGTIVDSRGWIVTSCNAVKGASKIEVRSSVSSINDFWDAKPLTDLVRGYVEVSEDDDLVLLSINRRFIVAFTFFDLPERSNIVEGQYVIQCAPPSRRNLYGATEAKIQHRGEFETLDKNAQSLVSRMGLTSQQLTWLIAATRHKPDPGTPVFDGEGKFMALNSFVHQNSDDQVLAFNVPIDKVANMIEDSNGEIKPLRDLGGDSADAPVAVAVTNEMHDSSVRLNQLAESCKDFQWIPRTDSDYKLLQQFAEKYFEIEAYSRLKEGTQSTEEKKIIAQKDGFESLLHDRFTALEHENELLLTQANEAYAEREILKSNRTVPFYGEVHFLDVVNSQLILRVMGTDTFVKAPVSQRGRPLQMNSKWLFFVQTPPSPGSVKYKVSESRTIEAESVTTILNFGQQ